MNAHILRTRVNQLSSGTFRYFGLKSTCKKGKRSYASLARSTSPCLNIKGLFCAGALLVPFPLVHHRPVCFGEGTPHRAMCFGDCVPLRLRLKSEEEQGEARRTQADRRGYNRTL
uniref:Uncharacterized protein n=1 Tax=Knipowitschia caucasica TaxID=637954 RepID=A0AAV2JR57_KNICA